MAKLRCICDMTLSNSMFPNLLEGTIRGDYCYEEKEIWECPYCGRLAIDKSNEQGLAGVKWYTPEDGKIGELFDITNSSTVIKEIKKSINLYFEKLKEYEDIFIEGLNGIWVPVEKALPDIEIDVLVCIVSNGNGVYGKDEKYFSIDRRTTKRCINGGFIGDNQYGSVTHWMKLPEFPTINDLPKPNELVANDKKTR